MHAATSQLARNRCGITLLEVLIAMFVLAVGILSVFGLFTAGRELESRAAIKSEALAFAATLRTTICNEWLDRSQWLHPTSAASPPSYAALTTTGSYCLPVLIDPWALCAGPDVQLTGTTAGAWPMDPDGAKWDWRRMTPLASGTTVKPFRRITLPAITGGTQPLTREGAIASLSDQDAVEFTPPADQNAPPGNTFELGRRKRGSNLVPALFLAARSANASSFVIDAATPVQRTLLIFNKPVADFETAADGGTDWPAGFLELPVVSYEEGLIRANVAAAPADQTVVRRSLRPGNWLLLTKREPPAPANPSPPHYFSTKWTKMTSVTQDSDESWLIVVEKDIADGSTAHPSALRCYAFEHLVHVVDDFEPASLP
jgi:hypothetical protein